MGPRWLRVSRHKEQNENFFCLLNLDNEDSTFRWQVGEDRVNGSKPIRFGRIHVRELCTTQFVRRNESHVPLFAFR